MVEVVNAGHVPPAMEYITLYVPGVEPAIVNAPVDALIGNPVPGTIENVPVLPDALLMVTAAGDAALVQNGFPA